MNPFLYPALIVLCLCGLSTAGALALPLGGLHGFAPLLIAPVWITAGWMLAAIALAPRDGVGAALIVTTVLLVSCAACVIFLANSSEKRSRERRARMYASTGSEK